MIPDPPADGDLLLLGYNIADQATFLLFAGGGQPLLCVGKGKTRLLE